MYQLISVSNNKLEINTAYFDTKEEAQKAMLGDILLRTKYNSLEEILKDVATGSCGYTEDDAWGQTFYSDTIQWKIEEIAQWKTAGKKAETFDTSKSLEEIIAERDANNYVEAYIEVDIDDIIGKNYEEFLDFISEELVGSDLLMDIDYAAVGMTEDYLIILRVFGDVSNIIDSEDDEDE